MIRILLLMLITLVLLMMISCPGSADSKRYFASHRRYYDARLQHKAAPTRQTELELENARREIEETRRLDRRDMMVFEAVMLGILGIAVYAFIRTGRQIRKAEGA